MPDPCMLRCPTCGSTLMAFKFNLDAPVPYDKVSCASCGQEWDREYFIKEHGNCILTFEESKKATAERDAEPASTPAIDLSWEGLMRSVEAMKKHYSDPQLGLRPMPPVGNTTQEELVKFLDWMFNKRDPKITGLIEDSYSPEDVRLSPDSDTSNQLVSEFAAYRKPE